MTRVSEVACANPDAVRWNRKYDDTSFCTHGPEPEAEPELLAYQALLDGRGLALEAAAGRGNNALYLATVGYKVIACDLAINGLSPCAASARKRAWPVYCMVCDLESYRFPEQSFDMISVVRYLNRSIFPELVNWLKPGGLLFYKTFNRNFLEKRSGFNPGYVLEHGELDDAFSAMDILISDRERAGLTGDAPATSFILARKK